LRFELIKESNHVERDGRRVGTGRDSALLRQNCSWNETAILCAAVRRHGRDIILDLANVDALDAAGIGAFISLQAAGVYLTLSNPNVHVREVLRITGLESVFEIRDGQTAEGQTANELLDEFLLAHRS
jgi:anti-anti-sigma factor